MAFTLTSIIFLQTFRHLDLQYCLYLTVTLIVHYFIHILIQPLAAIHNKPLLLLPRHTSGFSFQLFKASSDLEFAVRRRQWRRARLSTAAIFRLLQRHLVVIATLDSQNNEQSHQIIRKLVIKTLWKEERKRQWLKTKNTEFLEIALEQNKK